MINQKIQNGYCHCGCGLKTNRLVKDDKKSGLKKGDYRVYVNHHNRKGKQSGENNPSWRGGHTITNGYVVRYNTEHPRRTNNYVYDQILIAEKVLGKYLPNKALVHHVNGDTKDNRNSNLVICENVAYHNLLHRRMKALKACGHANWRKCWICKKYDNASNLSIIIRNSGKIGPIIHRECANAYSKKRRAVSKLQTLV